MKKILSLAIAGGALFLFFTFMTFSYKAADGTRYTYNLIQLFKANTGCAEFDTIILADHEKMKFFGYVMDVFKDMGTDFVGSILFLGAIFGLPLCVVLSAFGGRIFRFVFGLVGFVCFIEGVLLTIKLSHPAFLGTGNSFEFAANLMKYTRVYFGYYILGIASLAECLITFVFKKVNGDAE